MGKLYRRLMYIMAYVILLYLFVMYFMGKRGFGLRAKENKSDRVPEFDKFLMENAKALKDQDKVRELLPKFIELTKEISPDAECTHYYTAVLESVAELGLNTAMANERKIVNSKIAQSMRNGHSLSNALKMRHILDAFVDATALHAWPRHKENRKI